MLKLTHKMSRKAGLAPGSLIYLGKAKEEPPEITYMDYDAENVREMKVESIEQCADYKDTDTMTWINISGIHDVDLVEKVGKIFEVHPLVLEDILNAAQRPKSEDYDTYHYTVLKMLQLNEEGGARSEQVSIITRKNLVITLQEESGDVFDPVRRRIREAPRRVRMLNADYLTYALIDAVVDSYFVVMENFGETIEELQDEILSAPTRSTLEEVHHLKRNLIYVRKSIWPLREIISGLTRGESKLFSAETQVYLRDVYDHTIQVIETLENFRDMLSGMIDLYLSTASNRMNEVMKVLTIIATIFIPLTFIAGIYGMNFEFMPELKWRFGYFASLGVMLVIFAGMLIYFRKKDWI